MDAREYLEKVGDQIAVPGIREEIKKELLAHLYDQKEAFLLEGMSDETAEEAAVREMGDPVEVGIELNEIHKPKPVGKYVAAFLGVNAAMFAANAVRV